ncbi:MAG: hypothetical protein ACOC0N_00530 [Chroococcales cyanobacterium]
MATFNPAIIKSVEQQGYRVTVGDIASQTGLDINLAQQGLLALASDAGAHLQVAESGDIAYLFPRNFRNILRNKYLRLRLKEWWDKVWKILFYLIRISFGIILIVSIILIVVAITFILISLKASSEGDSDSRSSRGGGGMIFLPRFWITPDIFWFFRPNYYETRPQRRRERRSGQDSEMNFLEAIFSFLFGDGNPNADLEERRWREIGAVIRQKNGAVVAEQVAPYLDRIDQDEDYMLPVLTRFNGYPEVSPQGDIIYYFPELQVTARERRKQAIVPAHLQEYPWSFSAASSGQILLAAGLGGVNFVGALVLGSLLASGELAAQIGGLVAFVESIYGLLLAYGIGFLVIPLIRYFWIQQKNKGIEARNQKRRDRALSLQQANPALLQKIDYANQFASQKVIGKEDITYTTETDLIDQEAERSDKIDEEWRRRLEG